MEKNITAENNFQALYPELAAQWNTDRNGTLTPDQITPNSNKKVWWICPQGHEWMAIVANRTRKHSGCPYCANKSKISLWEQFPEIAAQWDSEKNAPLMPSQVTSGSNKKVWWKCNKGHEWMAVVASRTGKTKIGCPYCAGRLVSAGVNDLASLFPDVAAEWDAEKNEGLLPSEVTASKE